MPKLDPTSARDAYLATLKPEEAMEVLKHAEKVGPFSADSDWLVALAAHKASERFEKAIAEFESKAKPGDEKGHTCRANHESDNTTVVLWSVAVSLGIFTAIVEFVVQFHSAHLQEVAIYCMALAIGIAGSAMYASLAPYFIRTSERKR
jgi:hypothetical protein